MLKVKFNKRIHNVVDKMQKSIDKLTQEALNKMVDYATNQAQNTFDRFVFEVPADDPYVFVKSTPISKIKETTYTRTISCIGNQVLFIEFGAGTWYYTDTEVRLYSNILGGLNDRPPSIYEIGGYGSGRGKDDLWFYKSHTGRESENAHLIKFNRKGEPIMITHGNRPARALYRGVGMAIRRLKGGKL